MSEETIEIKTQDGVSDGYFYPPPAGSGPGVIMYTDILGLRPASRELAARIAGEGYAVLAPNVFYRTRKPPLFDFPVQFGEERTNKRFGELATPLLAPDAFERDARAYSEFLASKSGVKAGAQGVLGYCFTGQLALRTAAAVPERIAAAASFHGGGLWTDAPTSPHHVLPRVKARLYLAHASNDRIMPAEAIQQLEAALAAWGGKYESETYPAEHGWTQTDFKVYAKPEAERAFTKLLELLDTLR